MRHRGLQNGYSGLIDDQINSVAAQLAAQIKVAFVQGVEEYMASDAIQQKIADAKSQVITLAVVTGIATAALTWGLLKASEK